MNRFVLNETSYHGAGAIQAIPGEVKKRGLKRRLYAPTPTSLNSKLPIRYSPCSKRREFHTRYIQTSNPIPR